MASMKVALAACVICMIFLPPISEAVTAAAPSPAVTGAADQAAAAAAGTNPDLCKLWYTQCVLIVDPIYCQWYHDHCIPAP
jgi:hypothetical protein